MHAASDSDLGAALRDLARDAPVPSAEIKRQGLVGAIPELAALKRTPQDPRWHPEGNVLIHSLWAADLAAAHCEAEEVEPDRRELLVLASLLHDVGKPDTTRRRDGRITSHGHAERGAAIVRSLGLRLDLPRPLVAAVSALVARHMDHFSARGEPTRKAVRRLRDRLATAGTTLEDWAVVVRCDGSARGAAARPDASAPWMRVARTL